MQEVSGPVIAIALVLAAVFVPTAFIPGITGRLYQQFAVTIAVSTLISAFNALTLSPALAAILLKPKKKGTGLLQKFFDWFNRVFGVVTNGYVSVCRFLIRKPIVAILLLVGVTVLTGMLGKRVPGSFLPDEDQGYFYAQVILPDAASLQRTDEVMRQAEAILQATPGVEYVTTVTGYNFLTGVNTTYSGIFFITLKEWGHRKAPDEQYIAIMKHVNSELSKIPGARAFAFSPPAIYRHERRRHLHPSGSFGQGRRLSRGERREACCRSAGAQRARRRHADVFTRRAASFPERGPRQGA